MDHPYNQEPGKSFICGFINIERGGPLACFIWITINMYGCVLSFQGKSPIYSYLNHAMLLVQGFVCLWFVISALISLYLFTTDKPYLLRLSHRLTWSSVLIFLTYYFITLVIFGVQKDDFDNWCIDKSRQDVDQTFAVSVNSDSKVQISYTPSVMGSDLYNCNRLWESEIKFSSVLFSILFVIYIHFAYCFWVYTQDTYKHYRHVFHTAEARGRNGMMQNQPPPPPQNTNIMNNIVPQVNEKPNNEESDEQKSLAQIVRSFFSKLKK
ncbi:hypothetical protein K501DRAFT_237444 [Backusella circina FSU 941]|nr:hypothetical protein K501DRAFT_237444 [Backusella circina FSU 941]